MPDWSISQWLANGWGAEPDRDAALDRAEMGGVPPPSLADVLVPPVKAVGPDDYSPIEWYRALTADWPEVPNVIPPEKHVLGTHSEAVLNFKNRGREESKKATKLECNDYARYQLHIQRFSASGPPALDGNSKLVLEENGPKGARVPAIRLDEMVEAIWYFKSALAEGTPVMVGVKIEGYEREPNNIYETPYVVPTDHFVVVVGMGVESDTKHYVSYFNYHHSQKDTDRLYLKKGMLMESDVTGYRLTEVRRSYPR